MFKFDLEIFLDLMHKHETDNKCNGMYDESLKFLISRNLKPKLKKDFCKKYFLKNPSGIKDFYQILTDENKILEKEIIWIDKPNIISLIQIKSTKIINLQD